MWSENVWLEECELPAYLKTEREKAYREGYLKAVDTLSAEFATEVADLQKELAAVQAELIETLRRAATCDGDEYADCSICPWYDLVTNGCCPSKLPTYTAKLRLEELLNEESRLAE